VVEIDCLELAANGGYVTALYPPRVLRALGS